MIPDPQIVTFGNLRLAGDRIEEVQDGRAILTVQCTDIRSVHLRHGLMARHPIAQAVFAAPLTVISGAFVLFGAQMAQEGPVMIWPFLSGVFTLLGVWLLYDALRRGQFVEVWTGKGSVKLAIGKRLSSGEAARLSEELGRYGSGCAPES